MKTIASVVSAIAALLVLANTALSPTDAAQSSAIGFEGLETSYERSGEVAFVVANRGSGSISFYCGVERLVDGTWQPFLESVAADAPMKTARLQHLEGHQRIRLTWKPDAERRWPLVVPPGQYRLVATVVRAEGGGEVATRSGEFTLR